MKNLIFALSLLIIVSSCSKKPAEPVPVDQYIRATTELRQQITIYTVEEKATVSIQIKFAPNGNAKKSKVIGMELFSANNQIEKIPNLDLTSENVSTFYTYLFHTNALKEGHNAFTYTLQYEDGFRQKGSFDVYAIKDKTIGTWWEKVSYTHLDTVYKAGKVAIPIKDASEVKGVGRISYGRIPNLRLIDGLYGWVYALFDNEKKIQTIYVYHGADVYLFDISIIKDDILKAYPDCTVTESPDKSGYILKNSAFTFRLYKTGDDYFTEVKKNN